MCVCTVRRRGNPTSRESKDFIIRYAMELTKEIKEPRRQKEKYEIMLKAAMAYYRAGEKEKGLKLLSKILENGMQLKDINDREDLLEETAEKYAATGNFSKAVEIAQKTKNRLQEDYTLLLISKHVPIEKEELLHKIMMMIHNQHYRMQIFARMACEAQKKGDRSKEALFLKKAMDTVYKVETKEGPYYQIRAYLELALIYVTFDKKPEALQLLSDANKRIQKEPADAAVQYLINETSPKFAQAYARMGQFKKALGFVGKIQNPFFKVYGLGLIAEEYYKTGKKDAACELLNKALMISETIRVTSMYWLFEDDFGTGISGQGHAKIYIVLKYLAWNKLNKALETAEKIEEVDYKIYSMIFFAEKYAENKHKDKVVELLSKAFKRTIKIEYYYSKQILLCNIAEAYMNIGKLQKALTVIQHIGNNYWKAYVLMNIGIKHMKTGHTIDKQSKRLLEEMIGVRDK